MVVVYASSLGVICYAAADKQAGISSLLRKWTEKKTLSLYPAPLAERVSGQLHGGEEVGSTKSSS